MTLDLVPYCFPFWSFPLDFTYDNILEPYLHSKSIDKWRSWSFSISTGTIYMVHICGALFIGANWRSAKWLGAKWRSAKWLGANWRSAKWLGANWLSAKLQFTLINYPWIKMTFKINMKKKKRKHTNGFQNCKLKLTN